MKRIHYLFAFLVAVAAFSACKPLSKTYDTLGDVPTPTAPAPAPLAVTVTLAAADYKTLNKGAAAYTSLYFKSSDSAKLQIPTILASKYPTAVNLSTASVTYAFTPASIKLADSVNANVAITLQTTPTDDYKFSAFTYNGTAVAANSFDDLSATAVISWLRNKYQTPLPENSIRVLTYLYFESNVTASAGTLTTDAFLYTAAGDWQKIYRVKDAQYASIGHSVNSSFVASDAANLPTYFNTFLKGDGIVMATAKAGDVIYVQYKYQTSATAIFQRVLPLTFDGSNWTTTPNLLTLAFLKTNGVWVADNTINYKLVTADYQSIVNMTTINIATARANVASFGDFNITQPLSATTGWSDADINSVLVNVLTTRYGGVAVANQKFNVTYVAFSGSTFNVTKLFVYNGSAFVYTP